MLDQNWEWLDTDGHKRGMKGKLLVFISHPGFCFDLNFVTLDILLTQKDRWSFAQPRLCHHGRWLDPKSKAELLTDQTWALDLSCGPKYLKKRKWAWQKSNHKSRKYIFFGFLTRSNFMSNHGSRKNLFMSLHFASKNVTCLFFAH